MALNPDGTLKWSYDTAGIVRSSPAIGADGTIYFGTYDQPKLYALNPNGTLKWSYTIGGTIWSSPAIGVDSTIYIGSGDGKLYAIGEMPSLAVATDNADNVTQNSATLNGRLLSLGDYSPINVSFQWGTSSRNYTSETAPVSMSTTGAFNINQTGLTPGVTYYFRTKAVGNGTSYGTENSFTTLSNPPVVATDNATIITGNSVTLRGTLTSMGTATSVIISFQCGVNSGNYTFGTTPVSVNATGLFSANVTGLSANMTYYFRAKAVGDGIGYGSELSFTTGTEQTVEIALKAGWNMVSLPVIPANTAYNSVFPTALIVYTWNPVTKAYSSVANLEPAKGYWVAVTSDTVATVTGVPVFSWTNSVKAGWNMAGSVLATLGVSFTNPNDDPDGSVMAFNYWWNPVSKSYASGTTIETGKGYWIPALRDASLTVSTTSQ